MKEYQGRNIYECDEFSFPFFFSIKFSIEASIYSLAKKFWSIRRRVGEKVFHPVQIFVTAFPDVLLILFQLPVGGGGAVLVLSELESMAARQQREIAQQRRLLEQREARLAVLRGAQVRENHFFQPKCGNRSGNCPTKLL